MSRGHRLVVVAVGLALACGSVPAADAPRAALVGTVPTPPGYASLIPKPLVARPGRGVFVLRPTARIAAGNGASAAATLLAGLLRPATGYALPLVLARRNGGQSPPADLVVSVERRPALGGEGYELRVDAQRIRLVGNTATGLLRGVQTLRQLLPAEIESRSVRPGPWRVRTGTIRDRPRYRWRGAMLDVARHFFGVSDVKRYVDLLALYKLNRLHLHLTDDQGWRIDIRSWPRLARHGGSTEVGGGRGGFYTQADYRAIVDYARARGIVVVPEIELPGHVAAALSAYPELSCDGRPRPLYTGIPVPGTSLCVGRPVTERFVADVLREVAELTPGPYLHVGGDEATATAPQAYVAFVRRLQRLVRSLGKRLVGWEEIARARLDGSSVAQHWTDPRLARAAAARGDVVLSPATKAYLDQKYDASTPIGLEWAGPTDTRDAYSWDPGSHVPGIPPARVLGVEAPLWTETVATMADVELMAFPRLIGIAELGWSQPRGRSWAEYRTRLGTHGPRLRALGVRYHADPGVPWR